MATASADSGKTGASEESMALKIESLRRFIRNLGSAIIGLSAGVDSSLLAKVAHMELGEKAVAVTAVSPSLSAGDRQLAAQNAGEIGIRHIFLETHELEREDYLRNDAMRCFHCKEELSTVLWDFAEKEKIASVLLGVNASDGADFRPGIRAAAESGMLFPLRECVISKDEVRGMARMLGLSAHDRPSNSCLSSRVEYGQRIDAKLLGMVESAERMLTEMGLDSVRVRVHGSVARIEVDANQLPLLVSRRGEIVERFKSLGFLYVTLDLEGFRSGSMNLTLRSSQ